EQHDVPGVLVGGEQVTARRVKGEVARDLSLRGGVLHWRERSLRLVDGEHGDAVVPSIGAIKEFARAVHGNLGGSALTGKIIGQGRLVLQFMKRSAAAVVT